MKGQNFCISGPWKESGLACWGVGYQMVSLLVNSTRKQGTNYRSIDEVEPPLFQDVLHTLVELASKDERIRVIGYALRAVWMTYMMKFQTAFDGEWKTFRYIFGKYGKRGIDPFCNAYSSFMQRASMISRFTIWLLQKLMWCFAR